MRYRPFGTTGMVVSEIGFGAWGIGGAYGPVTRSDALGALACAEDLGCNFVDSALVYGDAEVVLAEFLRGRRQKWVVATKYSGQSEGITATLERQLALMQLDAVDFYQVHWYPRGREEGLFGELAKLKRDGKIRFAGVSLYSSMEVRDAVAKSEVDGFQIEFSLIQPNLLLAARRWLTPSKGVVVRSTLGGGLLSGRYHAHSSFADSQDQRRDWTRARIERALQAAQEFSFLEVEAGSLRAGAIRYPLSFEAVSTVVVGTKTVEQARANFGIVDGGLPAMTLAQIESTQLRLGLRDPLWRQVLTGLKLAYWPRAT